MRYMALTCGRRRAATAALTIALFIACGPAAVAARPTALPLKPSLICAAGMYACTGTFGSQCYAPSSGQACNNGMVCAAGQQICAGPWGAGCYSPAAGQRCQLGVVCGPGQSLCAIPGAPHCYTPARGERCQ